MNKQKKIINDPVHGFITIHSELILQIINHKYFQRLRRIKQLGLTDLVYPGALHTRFHHAIGAMHLMEIALNTLRNKGHEISDDEFESALIAILLHDIGHGPFSHALEFGLLTNVTHEELSLIIMEKLNEEFKGKLTLSIEIFEGKYKRNFFHQLVSSQLDVDRLDYLSRDYYFTGVAEGKVAADRILKMLEVKDGEIVVEEKGLYSVESFLNARRLMYWQVYLHKAVISAEFILLRIVQRAKELILNGEGIYLPDSLKPFFIENLNKSDFQKNTAILESFTQLDDSDVIVAIKNWRNSSDTALQILCTSILDRKLFKTLISNKDFSKKEIEEKKNKIKEMFNIKDDSLDYLLIKGVMSNSAYIPKDKKINILQKDGKVIDISEAVDLPNIKAISTPVQKYFLCWPKEIE